MQNRKKKNVKIIAHRGYSGKFTENSNAAFTGAVSFGAHGIEMDVQKTKDNNFVIFHDSDLNRMTGGRMPGKISEYTFRELTNTPLDKEGENIVGFESFLQAMPAALFLDIELKTDTIEVDDCPVLYDMILKYRQPGTFIVSSFNEKLLYYFKERKITIGLLMSEKYRGFGILKYPGIVFSLKPAYLNLSVLMFQVAGTLLSRLFITFFKVFGFQYMFWTVNSEDEFNRICNHADYIITNEVELMQKLAGVDPVQY